jgi:hypothetical protein
VGAASIWRDFLHQFGFVQQCVNEGDSIDLAFANSSYGGEGWRFWNDEFLPDATFLGVSKFLFAHPGTRYFLQAFFAIGMVVSFDQRGRFGSAAAFT